MLCWFFSAADDYSYTMLIRYLGQAAGALCANEAVAAFLGFSNY